MLKLFLKWIGILLLAVAIWFFGVKISGQIMHFVTGQEEASMHPVEIVPFLPEEFKEKFVPKPTISPIYTEQPKGTGGNEEPMPSEAGGMIACTMDAKICPDGSAVGRVGPNCEFAPCPTLEVPAGSITCEREQRNVDACIEIYQPVCGLTRVECVTTPCDPVPATYSNSCFACQDERVISYTEGRCESE